MAIYGYARISRNTQSIDRQIRNILAVYPSATIFQEAYTGTKIDSRKELQRLIKILKPNDTVVCDSVSRLSRNSKEGIDLYKRLYSEGINIVFLKEPHINTDTYKQAIEKQVAEIRTGNESADNLINSILEAVQKYTLALAEQQISLAFEQAEKEVADLHQRTKEGLLTAKLNGKRVGGQVGEKKNVKKKEPAKDIIRKHSKSFGGTLKDEECRKLVNLARNTYYKYKKEIAEELEQE